MTRKTSLPIHLLTEEQKDFIINTVDTDLYFSWEEGLVHKLGVTEFIEVYNPSAPVIRSESLIVFRDCTFDDFSRVPKTKGVRLSGCRFLSWEGYTDDWKDEIHGQKTPKFLWGMTGNHPRWGYEGIVLPSTGTRFVRGISIDSRIRDPFSDLYRAACNETEDIVDDVMAKSYTESFEKIWLTKLKNDFSEVFFESVSDLIPKHRDRALELVSLSETDYELVKMTSEKFL